MPGHWGRSSSSSSSKGSAAPGGTGGGGWSPGVGGQQHQPKAKTKTVTTGGQSPFAYTKPPKKKTTTVTTGGQSPFAYTKPPKKKTVTTGGASPFAYTKPPKKKTVTTGIPQTNKFKKWIASKFKKPMIEYFYPEEHGDMYIGLQTGTIPTSNYHKDVTADYWKNVSKNWSDVHPALGAMVNVGAPAGTMIGGPMYDWYQSGKRYEEDPNKYLSSFQQDVKATQFEPEVKAALEARGVTDISGVDTIGGMKAIAAEKPIKSNLQRMAGSVEPLLNAWGIGNNLNYAKGGIVDLYRYGGFSG